MKSAAVILVVVLVACLAVSIDCACPDSKFFKGTCNALAQDCQRHCTNLENAKSGQCIYKFPAFRCTCCH